MSTAAQAPLIKILLVEDSPTDVMITREALKRQNILNPLDVAEDGIKAMEYLNDAARQGLHALPGLILLDLNLPRKNGREVLQEVKDDPVLRTIPVVVLTTSSAQEDVLKSYGLHANCYIVKPVDFQTFAESVRVLNDFWFSIVTLPR